MQDSDAISAHTCSSLIVFPRNAMFESLDEFCTAFTAVVSAKLNFNTLCKLSVIILTKSRDHAANSRPPQGFPQNGPGRPGNEAPSATQSKPFPTLFCSGAWLKPVHLQDTPAQEDHRR